VIGVDQRPPRSGDSAFPFVLADLNDVHRMYVAASMQPLDAIVHCGGISGAMLARDNPFLICETNIRSTFHVLEIARARGVRRVVFCSTITAYGNQPAKTLAEDVPLVATNVYGASKVACEAIMRAYAKEHGVECVALRISHVYGPRRETECFVRQIIQDWRGGRVTRLPQAATSRRQYVYIDDVVEALRLALDTPEIRQFAYNISAGEEHTLAQLGELAGRVLGPVRVEYDAANDPPEYQIGKLDITAARRDLGFQPRIRLEQGIKMYANWLAENG
jgi:nucleoside-diphosphate-sugar epimerase